MKVIESRNVHQSLPMGIRLLQEHGVDRASRNGPVRVAPGPVTTVYQHPAERLVHWRSRDVNVAFLVYEALWMLAGRHDLAPLTRYVKDFGKFSDDGLTLHGAYGHRWRMAFGFDQLPSIVTSLVHNPEDRRCVLQMWDARLDLGNAGKDLPCNDVAMLQRDAAGALDITVCCRSNDLIWGAAFANAFHFSLLQEYLARWIGCQVGVYRQVSVNYHAYHETLAPLADLPAQAFRAGYADPQLIPDPYRLGSVRALPLLEQRHGEDRQTFIRRLDAKISETLMHADTGFTRAKTTNDDEPWFEAAYAVLRAHELWRTLDGQARYEQALYALAPADQTCDMVASMQQWLTRRYDKWARTETATAQV